MPATKRRKSKTLATWIALLGGSLGLHRFYLAGVRDVWGWLYPLPTLLGLYGVLRMLEFGHDDHLAWLLIPLLGIALSAAMLSAIVYGLTNEEAWLKRFGRSSRGRSGWLTVIGVVLALMVGASVLMATIAFSSQRFFEYQVDGAPPVSR